MANTSILLKRSGVSGNTPPTLEYGELSINYADGVLFYKDDFDVIQTIRNTNGFSTVNANSDLLISTSPTDVLTILGNDPLVISGNPSTDTITISVVDGSTSTKGVVQLYDGVDSTSTILSATANSVNAVYNYVDTIAGGQLTTNFKSEEFTATTNQTTFTVTNGYTPEYISVYVNGVLLSSSDYTADNGTSVILSDPASLNDSVVINKWFFDNSIYLSALQKVEEFTATTNQTTFTISGNYDADYIKVYRNGVLLETSDYTANGGSVVELTNPANLNDIVSIEYWGANTIDATPVFIAANNAVNAVDSKMNDLQYANLFSINATTSTSTANQTLDSFSTSEYRSVKYQIQVSSGADYQVSEINLIHNGTNSYITEYGLVVTNSTLMNYDTDINSGDVRLLMSPVNPTNTVKLVKTSILV